MKPPTRNVVVDLWPLYVSGEASADTRALVEDFLEQEPELGERLRGTAVAIFAGIALVLAQLCWLALLNEASIAMEAAYEALPAARP